MIRNRAYTVRIASFAILFATSQLAYSQSIETQPTEVISATPLQAFSDRSGLWPSQELTNETESRNEKTLVEIFNSVPGVQAREAGSPTISIRGSAAADRVLKLYEGVPLNLADGIGASDLFIPQESIGSVRLFKGPASAFYGTSAMAGAVDHRVARVQRPTLRASGSLYNNAARANESLYGALPFGSSDSPGHISGYFERRNGRYPYRSVTGFGEGNRDNSAMETARLNAAWDLRLDNVQVRPRLLLAKSVGENPGPLNAPYATSFDNTGSLVAVEVQNDVADSVSLSIRLADVRQWGLFDRDTTFQSTSVATRSSLAADLQVGLDAFVVSRTFFDVKWDTLAASYLGDSRLNQNDVEIGETFEISLTPSIALQPAIRYRAETGDFLKAVGVLRSVGTGRQWITYAEGFRAPSLSDRFADVSFFKGNQSLLPERSQSFEIGFQLEPPLLSNKFKLEGAAYHIAYEDLFDTVAAGAMATTKVNSGRATAKGVEAGVSYSLDRWTFGSGYNFLEAKNETLNEPLRLSPKHQATLKIARAFHQTQIETLVTYWSSFFDRETPSNVLKELPPWTTVDLTVTHQRENWRWRGGILNVFDVARELTYAFPEAQRRFFLSAQTEF